MKNRKIECSTRCLDAGTVKEVRSGLETAPVSSVPYACKVSGKEEEVFLVSPELARTIAGQVATLRDPLDAILAAATFRTQLCECDLATLAHEPEAAVLEHLDALERAGVLTRKPVHGMNYYGLATGETRDAISTLLEPHIERLRDRPTRGSGC